MKTVRPQPLGALSSRLPLTPEEGFVLSRIDGRLSVSDLVALTGIDEPRIEKIVEKLVAHGAVALESATAEAIATGWETPLGHAAAHEAAREEIRDEPPTLGAGCGDSDEESPPDDVNDGAHAQENDRQLYEARFHGLSVDARAHAAKTARGVDLRALCFDADPRVVAAILENPTCGLEHVRLVAFHHRTGTGLELLSRRADYLRDALVERRLLRNPQAGDVVLGRVFASKRVLQTYAIAIDRDVPELTRAKGRGFLRQKFQGAPSEERADLVVRTEGRCLAMMTGCTFDAKATAILCGRPYNSVLFIQNLARFSATPPALLAHLMKQPFVCKSAPLKRLLLQHPNLPGDAKRPR